MTSVSANSRTEWSLRLAQALVAGGYATETNLSPLLTEAQATGQPLGALLIARQLALPGVVVGTLAQLAQLPAVDLAAASPDPQVIALIPAATSREYGAVAMKADANQLAVAFGEPPADEIVQTLSGISGYRVAPMLADPTVISALLASVPPEPSPHPPSGAGAPCSARSGNTGGAPPGRLIRLSARVGVAAVAESALMNIRLMVVEV